MNKSSLVHVVYGTDRFFLKPMVVSAISAIKNLKAGRKICLHVLYKGIAGETIAMLKDFFKEKFSVEINFYDVNKHPDKDIFAGESACPEKHISDSMFNRLFAPYLINDVEKVIYLDSDTIVNGDLSEMYDIGLAGNLCGAIIETFFDFKPEEFGYRDTKLINLDIDTLYFNSGVLLFDLQKLREFGFLKKCAKFYLEYRDKVQWPDQDLLNAVLGKQTLFIPPKYNSLNWNGLPTMDTLHEYFDYAGKVLPYSKEEIEESIHKPVVIHYVGAFKPWLHPGKYYAHKEKYWKYFNMSPWKDSNSELVEAKLLQGLS